MQTAVQNLAIWSEITVNGILLSVRNAPEHLRQDRINEAYHFLSYLEKGVSPVVAECGISLEESVKQLRRELVAKPETPKECSVCPAVKRLEDFVAAFYANLRAQKGGGK